MKNELVLLFKKNYLFSELTNDQISDFISLTHEIVVPESTPVINEGEIENEMYLVLEGKLQVLKKDEKSGLQHQIAIIEGGEVFGEMSLIDSSPRSASVRTLEKTKLLRLEFAQLFALAKQKVVLTQIILNLSKQLAKRLRKTGEVAVKSLQSELEGAKLRVETGRYLFTFLVFLSIWIIVISIIKKYAHEVSSSTLVTIPMLLVFTSVLVYVLHRSIFPLSYFGFTTNNWKKYILESLIFTLPILVFASLVKFVLIKYDPIEIGDSFFYFLKVNHNSPISPFLQIGLPYLYVLFTPVQEFIARGFIQSAVRGSLTGPHSVFWSIILSNLVFSAFHAHLSIAYVLAAFIGGCFWGWLYARQGSLIGPIFSHALVGWWCLSVLGFGVFLTKSY